MAAKPNEGVPSTDRDVCERIRRGNYVQRVSDVIAHLQTLATTEERVRFAKAVFEHPELGSKIIEEAMGFFIADKRHPLTRDEKTALATQLVEAGMQKMGTEIVRKLFSDAEIDLTGSNAFHTALKANIRDSRVLTQKLLGQPKK